MQITDLMNYLNKLLQPELFNDYCPNGLQVEGRDEIKTLITGVTACQALLDAAVAKNADAILVHHGYFWKGESLYVTGVKRKRLATLLTNNINLISYHLPLDAHSEFGNNVELARLLDIKIEKENDPDALSLGCIGHLTSSMTGDELSKHIAKKLGRAPLHISSPQKIKKVAWCTGAAQDFITDAANAGVDAYITGEISERTVYLARESGLHFYAAGHHATERYGVKALGEHLSKQFDLKHEFIDIDNPV